MRHFAPPSTEVSLHPNSTTLFSLTAALLVSATAASAAVPQDLGSKNPSDVKSVSLVLKVHDLAALSQLAIDTTNPRSSSYHRFLSPAQFTARFSPSPAEVAAVVGDLQAAGIKVTDVAANRLVLKATGTVGALNRYFAVDLHEFVDGARRYHAPDRVPTVPSSVKGSVITVVGLSTEPIYRSRLTRTLKAEGLEEVAPAFTASGTATGTPGRFTVGDVARLYQVAPLYRQGFKGQGRTVGIATLANFDPADAYAYWAAIGLTVKPNRISQVHVDGGSDFNGADETALDVEQSGGLAPAADIIVYDAPNTDQGFLDVFVQAVIDNKVDTLSVSWGSPEIATTPALAAGQDQVFLQAAVQGISLFAASGDSGAYDINNSQSPYAFPGCTNTLTVDSPAASPFLTAAGGLTLAGAQKHHFATPAVNVVKDRPWGWNYLADYFNTNYPQYGGYYGVAFPVGGGGGVSVNEALPWYQQRTAGIRTSQPSQSLVCQTATGAADFIDLPDDQPGRNLPDLSLNADPYTGYLLYFGGKFYAGFGGTSFVAPQLNGILNIVGQATGGRLGLINPAIYRLARHGGYEEGAFNDIATSDNLGFQATPGYDAASGLGSINAANLAAALSSDEGEDGE